MILVLWLCQKQLYFLLEMHIEAQKDERTCSLGFALNKTF